MNGVAVCPQCGAKIRAAHPRCPRCREKLSDSASRFNVGRLAPLAIGLLLMAALIAGVAFRRQAGEADETQVTGAVLRPPAPTRGMPAAGSAVDTASAAMDAGIPFIEPNRAGGVAYQAGNYEGALEQYREAVRRHSQDAESWSNLGQVLVRLNRAEEAVPHFQRAIALNGERWAYHFNLARALGLIGRWPEAVDSYRAAQRLYPEDYAIAFNLGLALRKSGDDAAAIEQFEKAIALEPADPTFHFSLAMSFDKLGRKADAVEAYQRTLELAPEAAEVPQIRARISALLN